MKFLLVVMLYFHDGSALISPSMSYAVGAYQTIEACQEDGYEIAAYYAEEERSISAVTTCIPIKHGPEVFWDFEVSP